jgi:hypothetical protein
MSLKKIEQVKKDKGFRLFDLIIYGVIVLTVAVLFIVIFTTRDTDPLTGVRIFVDSQEVFSYEFGGEPTRSDGVTVEEDANGITVTIRTDDDLNLVYIDKSAKTVKMLEANCKGQQCMYFPVMDNNSKFIYCSPHRLRIEPYSVDLDDPFVIV